MQMQGALRVCALRALGWNNALILVHYSSCVTTVIQPSDFIPVLCVATALCII